MHLSVRTKLTATAGLVLVVSSLIAFVGVRGFRSLEGELNSMYQDRLVPVKSILTLKSDLMEARALVVSMINEVTEKKQHALADKITAASKRVDDGLDAIKGMQVGQADLKRLGELQSVWGQFKTTRDEKIIPAVLAGDTDAAVALAIGVQAQRFGEMSGILAKLIEELDAGAVQARTQAQATGSHDIKMLMVISGAGVLVALVVAFLIARSILRPITSVAVLAEQLAQGNLAQSLEVRSRDEVGRMSEALNRSLEGMRAALQAERVDWARIGEQRKELDRVVAMVETAPLNIMYADEELTVRYLNPASRATMTKLSADMRLSADQIQGRTLDCFHEGLAQVREVAKDRTRLPWRTELAFGAEHVDMTVSGVKDSKGAALGTMVTWEVVTERVQARARERELALREKQQAEEQAQREREQSERERKQVEERARLELERADRERGQAKELQDKVDQVLEVVAAAAQGDLTREIPVVGEDAIGRMGAGLTRLFSDLRTSIGDIAKNAAVLATSSDELNTISSSVDQNAQRTSSEANAASSASEQVSRSVESVATAVNELVASVNEISRSASEAAHVATEAVQLVGHTNTMIGELGQSSAEIGDVIRLITSVAQQTNLLALNATIEAARAGEAGKGFAVVANEVKALASQTASATSEVSKRIEAIQSGTTNAVEAIQKVNAIIVRINEFQTTIASAVEEQAATTTEIQRNLTEAAKGTSEIVRSVTTVAGAATDTTRDVGATKNSAQGLSVMAADLKQLVTRFRYEKAETAGAAKGRR